MNCDLAALLDATWPAASMTAVGPFTLREGAGGGKRVSAATASGAVTPADIDAAERAMDARGQQAIFAVGADQAELDAMLVARTYLTLDPTRLHRIAVDALADLDTPPNRAFSVWPPLQVQKDIWAAGKVGAARLAIMERAPAPKTALLGRVDDSPAGSAFVAVHDRIGIVHALEVAKARRRAGAARLMLVHAARWARARGADRLVALVTEANRDSAALFDGLGFAAADAYHYRIRP